MLLVTSVIVKVIGAVYKIPLTAFIGAVGRGYFATAYNLYLPLHAVIMGAMPIALSRLVSKYNASDDKKMLSSLRKGSMSLFALIGVIGSLILVAAAKPYSVLIAASPDSVYTMLVLAPNLFFCCLAACYRGYYEGYLNMLPTSVSQTVEAVFKTVFGLLFAKICMAYMIGEYRESGMLFGNAFADEREALSFIYPFSSAAAMLGVTAGSLGSLLFVFIYDKINHPCLPYAAGRDGRRELFSFSLPIMLSCAVQSIFQFIDTASVQYALNCSALSSIRTMYSAPLELSQTLSRDTVTYVYGLFCTALDFKNLIPGITMALGVCAVPAICREYERKNFEKTASLINSIYKYTSLLSVFLSGFIFICAGDILKLFYGASSPDVVTGCEQLVKYFAITAPLYSFASSSVFFVQALGKPEKSVMPYVVSGIIRCVLNVTLVMNERFILNGAIISGAAGYFVMFIMNERYVKKLSRVRFLVKNILIKPAVIGIFSCFLSNFLFFKINFLQNLFVKLLIEMTIFGSIYCILCFFAKVLDFKEIFSMLNFKKNGLNT